MLCGGSPARVRSSTCATASRPTSGVNVSSRQAGGRRVTQVVVVTRASRSVSWTAEVPPPITTTCPSARSSGSRKSCECSCRPRNAAAAGVGRPERLLPGAGRVDQAARPPHDGLVGPVDAAGPDEQPSSSASDSTRVDADGALDAELERVLVLREVVRDGEGRGLGGVADDQGHPGQLVHAVRVGHGQAGPPVLPRATGLRRCRRARRTSPPPRSQPRSPTATSPARRRW